MKRNLPSPPSAPMGCFLVLLWWIGLPIVLFHIEIDPAISEFMDSGWTSFLGFFLVFVLYIAGPQVLLGVWDDQRKDIEFEKEWRQRHRDRRDQKQGSLR